MENEETNSRKKIMSERAWKILKREGLDITLEQAKGILQFLRKLANIAVTRCLKKKDDEKDSRPIRKSKYR